MECWWFYFRENSNRYEAPYVCSLYMFTTWSVWDHSNQCVSQDTSVGSGIVYSLSMVLILSQVTKYIKVNTGIEVVPLASTFFIHKSERKLVDICFRTEMNVGYIFVVVACIPRHWSFWNTYIYINYASYIFNFCHFTFIKTHYFVRRTFFTWYV